jgi:hypothetical protein
MTLYSVALFAHAAGATSEGGPASYYRVPQMSYDSSR